MVHLDTSAPERITVCFPSSRSSQCPPEQGFCFGTAHFSHDESASPFKVKAVPGVLVKQAEQARGTPLIGLNCDLRAETRDHIELGARSDGKFVGYSHEGWEISSRPRRRGR